ncbi:MAG: hypothetical protein R3C44_23800 [Chloroflexota bacterium]
MDAALGINDIPDKLEYLVKGYRHAYECFNLFRNSELVGKGSNLWFKDKVVTMFDDHDQVRKGKQKPGLQPGMRAIPVCRCRFSPESYHAGNPLYLLWLRAGV